ncbi:efflux transporter outer membrane subunit [Undibacterium terreum]|uniref:Multidrug resistance transporter n=1 Tax=Undibacterium terreum TaxID=1224302 RepID=A0A916XJH2_9BURK|nr:efflux transporter outer membrane subunit [Undibacterium terreum]GGC78114.1 multidrug resistance transporter [Undibacterium terreum]
MKTELKKTDPTLKENFAVHLFKLKPSALKPGTLGVALAIAIAGCATVPPDRNIYPQQDMAKVQLAAGIKLASEGWPDKQWWTQYADPQLNSLIAQALAGSPSLEIAAARIDAAHATLEFNGADKAANVNLNTQGNRQRYSSNGLFPAPIGGNYFTETVVQVQARYDFDWWGKHRAQIASALGEVNARRADYAQAEQTLAASIAQSYFNLQGGWARLENLRQTVATQKNIVTDKSRRIAGGLGTIDQQRMAEGELSTLNKQVAQLEAQVATEREVLRALVGADGSALADLKPQAIPSAPHALPAQLGMDLLARRADLQAARWRVEASLSQIEVAQAAFYPDVSINGAIGLDSLSLSHLLENSSRTLFAGPALTLPLFDSRRLEARLGSVRSERNELIADYNQSVLNAVRDVAQQALSVRGLEQQIAEQDEVIRANRDLLKTAQAKFKQGLADRGSVLNAELALSRQQDISLQLRNQQLQTEVALTKALGGGYRADSGPAPTPTTANTAIGAATVAQTTK